MARSHRCFVRHAAFHRPVVAGAAAAAERGRAPPAHYPIRQRDVPRQPPPTPIPSSEWCLVAATLGAQMNALRTRGARRSRRRDYFTGIMTTAWRKIELLAQVRIPLLTPPILGFQEFSRRWRLRDRDGGDVQLDGRTIVEPRIGVGGGAEGSIHAGQVRKLRPPSTASRPMRRRSTPRPTSQPTWSSPWKTCKPMPPTSAPIWWALTAALEQAAR